MSGFVCIVCQYSAVHVVRYVRYIVCQGYWLKVADMSSGRYHVWCVKGSVVYGVSRVVSCMVYQG